MGQYHYMEKNSKKAPYAKSHKKIYRFRQMVYGTLFSANREGKG
jgi:hypothetical protein